MSNNEISHWGPIWSGYKVVVTDWSSKKAGIRSMRPMDGMWLGKWLGESCELGKKIKAIRTLQKVRPLRTSVEWIGSNRLNRRSNFFFLKKSEKKSLEEIDFWMDLERNRFVKTFWKSMERIKKKLLKSPREFDNETIEGGLDRKWPNRYSESIRTRHRKAVKGDYKSLQN